jgi:hypothetical protein
MNIDEMIDLLPASWIMVAAVATAVAAIIFVRLGRRHGWRWALAEMSGSFFPPIE